MPSLVFSAKDSKLARRTLSSFKAEVSRPTIWARFSRASTRLPNRSGVSMRVMASSSPRVARVVEASPAVRTKAIHGGRNVRK